MSDVQGNDQGPHQPSQNRRHLLEVASMLDRTHEWHNDLRKSLESYADLDYQGHNVKCLIDAMKTEIERRGEIERTWLKFFIQYEKNKGEFLSMGHNFPMICPDENDSKPPTWDFNKKTLLKWQDGVHFNINPPPSLNKVDAVDGTEPSEDGHSTNEMEVVVESADPNNQVVVFGTQGKYQPSRKLLGVPANRDADVLHRVNEAGVELGNYRGDAETLLQNADCTEDENCAVYIRNIHPDALDHEIFGEIFEGAIYQYARQPAVNQKYYCHAATVVFKRRQSALEFMNRINTTGISIRNIRLTCILSRNRVRPNIDSFQSRVLQFMGPSDHFNIGFVLEFLSQNVESNIISQREWDSANGDQRVVELAFASIRGQGRLAFNAFRETFVNGVEGGYYSVAYVLDPCGI